MAYINPLKKKLKEGKIPVIKKKLEGGIVAEANNDGSIYLDKKVKTNSPKAKEAIAHEKVHIDQMARGDLNYDDNNVYWKGKKYPRDAMNEGSKGLPWESEAYNKTEHMKKSPLKKLNVGLSQDVLAQRAGMMEDELKIKADKHAAIGRATAQIASRVPDKFGGSGQGSWGKGTPLNPTNKSKSPLKEGDCVPCKAKEKATPITAKAGSALKMGPMPPPAAPATAPAAAPAGGDVKAEVTADGPKPKDNPAGDIAETEEIPKKEEQQEEKKEEGGGEEEQQEEEKKEEKKGGASHVGYSNPTTSYEKGYAKEAAAQSAAKLKSPLKIDDKANTRVSKEVKNVNVGETSGKLTTTKTETDTKEEKEGVKKFRDNCYNGPDTANPGSRKAEGSVVNGMTCSWDDSGDWDPESEYEVKTHVSYDDAYEPDRVTTPGTPGKSEEGDQYNMGYHEAMDAKWAAGVKGRGAKKVSRKSQAAGKKWDRMDGRGKTPIGPDGKKMTREAYVESIAGAYKGNYDQAIGSTKKVTTQVTEGTDEVTTDAKSKKDNPNYELDEKTGRYVLKADSPEKMGKNKNKSPLKKGKLKKFAKKVTDAGVDVLAHSALGPISKIPSLKDKVQSFKNKKNRAFGLGVNYKEAYADADKKKYPTQDSFTDAAKKYNENKKTKSAFKLKGWKAQ
jgi:hypothetical protein